MIGTNFASYIRFLTRTNTATLPDATIVLLANPIKDDFAGKIIKANEDFFGLPQTRNLIASATSREYSMPKGTINIKRVEAMFDSVTWVKLSEKDLTEMHKGIGSESQITSQFTNDEGNCFFDYYRNSLWLYSGTITAVTAGLKLWSIEWPANIAESNLANSVDDLSDDPSSTTSQIPRQFHKLWATRVSIEYKASREKPIPLSEREQMFDQDFEKAMEAVKSLNQDRVFIAKIPSDTHLQF